MWSVECGGTTCNNDNTAGDVCSQGSFEPKATTTAFLFVKQVTRVVTSKDTVQQIGADTPFCTNGERQVQKKGQRSSTSRTALGAIRLITSLASNVCYGSKEHPDQAHEPPAAKGSGGAEKGKRAKEGRRGGRGANDVRRRKRQN